MINNDLSANDVSTYFTGASSIYYAYQIGHIVHFSVIVNASISNGQGVMQLLSNKYPSGITAVSAFSGSNSVFSPTNFAINVDGSIIARNTVNTSFSNLGYVVSGSYYTEG